MRYLPGDIRWGRTRGATTALVVTLAVAVTGLPKPDGALAPLALVAAASLVVLAVHRGVGAVRARHADAPSPHQPLTVPVSDRLVAAREAERSRLRVDLHDDLVPALAGIRLRLDVAAARVTHPAVRRLILEAASETSRTVDGVRHILEDLNPPDLEGVGLVEALRRLVHRFDMHPTIELRPDLPERLLAPEPTRATSTAAYRIASEALANVLRHARARTAELRLVDRGSWLVVEVLDDGVGLPTEPTRGRGGRGVGLSSMARRAEEVGGYCHVAPRRDVPHGTVVRAVLPKHGHAEQFPSPATHPDAARPDGAPAVAGTGRGRPPRWGGVLTRRRRPPTRPRRENAR